jgi:hypothetical protein
MGTPQFWISGSPPPMGCAICAAKNSVADPIDPTTGSVLSSATDVVFQGAGVVGFRRYYNSNDATGADLSPGWRHSYDRTISAIYSNPTGQYVPSIFNTSSQYANASDACTSGISEIGPSIPGWSSATASYSNGVCVVTKNSVVIAALPVFSSPTAQAPQSSPIEYDVVRDDGQVLRFPVLSGVVTTPPGASLRLSVTGSGYTVTDDDDTVES